MKMKSFDREIKIAVAASGLAPKTNSRRGNSLRTTYLLTCLGKSRWEKELMREWHHVCAMPP